MQAMKSYGIGDCVPIHDDVPPLLCSWHTQDRERAVYVCGVRIAGCVICPKCKLQWPLYQETEVWTDKGKKTPGGKRIMEASGWDMGHGHCLCCDVVVIAGLDQDYVIECGQ